MVDEALAEIKADGFTGDRFTFCVFAVGIHADYLQPGVILLERIPGSRLAPLVATAERLGRVVACQVSDLTVDFRRQVIGEVGSAGSKKRV